MRLKTRGTVRGCAGSKLVITPRLPWVVVKRSSRLQDDCLRSVKGAHVCERTVRKRVSTAEEGARNHVEVAVLGGGQAGLAMAYYLREQERRFVNLERRDSIAHAWRERWDSLRLFSASLAPNGLAGARNSGDRSAGDRGERLVFEQRRMRGAAHRPMNAVVGESSKLLLDGLPTALRSSPLLATTRSSSRCAPADTSHGKPLQRSGPRVDPASSSGGACSWSRCSWSRAARWSAPPA